MTPPLAARHALAASLHRLGWEVADLAFRVEVHPRTVYRWLSGSTAVDLLAIDRTRRFRVIFREEYERLLVEGERVAA